MKVDIKKHLKEQDELAKRKRNPKIWFTSDTHFGHKNIIHLCKRPVKDVEEMNELLIKNWNSMVHMHDMVYHLGDFSMGNSESTQRVLDRLSGHICLVRGNHDRVIKGSLEGRFELIEDYMELKVPGSKKKIIMMHYPIESWNKQHWGSWHLHGHCHGNLNSERNCKRLDVGVDTNNLMPYSLEQVTEIMKTKGLETADHHESKAKAYKDLKVEV